MADARRRSRSPVTQPGYRRGRSPRNKGRKLPTEVLTSAEIKALLDSFGSSMTDTRNRAIVLLMYRAGLKVGQVIALERRHYEPGSATLMAPGTNNRPDSPVALDAETRDALDRWMEFRKGSGVPVSAPLFCTITVDSKGNRLYTSYLRVMLKAKAEELGIDRRATCEGLRRSGIDHRSRAHSRVAAHLAEYVDEDALQSRYPDAFEMLEAALDLFAVHPVRHATPIGHNCREAMLAFVDTALARHDINVSADSGTVTKLRTLIREAGPKSRAIAAHLKVLIEYWGTTSDLANRQEHGARRERDRLRAEDAQRLVFHTVLVMTEIDRALNSPL